MKTVYCLRTRFNDKEDWSEPDYYRSRKERDNAASMCRVVGGVRTHSFEVKKSKDEIAELFG